MFLSSVAGISIKKKLAIAALGEISLQPNFLPILFHLVVIYCILDTYIATPFLLLPRVIAKKNTVLLWFRLVSLACKKWSYI
jgi:hypothetical protein